MTNDQKKLYIASVLTVAVLLALCAIKEGARYACAGALVILVPLCFTLVPRRKSLSIRKREFLLLALVFGVLFVVLTQFSGLFFEFYKNPYFVSPKTFLTTVLPIAVIIIGSELIRSVLVIQNNRLASVAAFLICILSEILMFDEFHSFQNLNHFMDLLGMAFLPAITGGFLYHYAAQKSGAWGNIAYRLITTLYVYFIPMISGISDALISLIKILLPMGILALLSSMYEKRPPRAVRKKSDAPSKVFLVLLLLVTVGVAMLISCQFRFGALVIATESMSGEINKGDVIIYERYDDKRIEEGQVVVFTNNKDDRVVHRVVKIEEIGGEMRYYTKGDANNTPDFGYRTDADIVGLTDLKLPYLGYPSLWLREIIQN